MILRFGSKGNNVLYLQYGLHILCFSSKGFDSDFGSNTLAAVKNFQRSYGLSADGIVGDMTWSKLKEEIRVIQGGLNRNGIDIGAIDGIAGINTYNGVVLFQKNNGLVTDGQVGSKTRKALFYKEVETVYETFNIFIDPGHGGSDPGATCNGLKEKDIVLKMSLELRDILIKKGYKVKLSREKDVFVSLEERATLANAFKANLFISIHCNSAKSKEATGTESFTYPSASYVTKGMCKSISKDISNKLNLVNRGQKEANFAVLRLTKMSAILVETAFLSNVYDAGILKNNTSEFAKIISENIKI